MKYLNQLLGMVLLVTASTLYSCNLMAKEHKTTTLLTSVTKEQPAKQFVKIALLLDTSNSMDGLINQAKGQLWDIVNEFTHARCGNEIRPELQIALYEYGNDNLSSSEGYIRQVLGFSDDLDEISEKLFSLTTNGGEEFCGEVIQTSLKQLDWGKNPDDLKMIFIAGNEPFTQGKLNYKDAAHNAKEKDVVVNTIFCGNYEQGISTDWKNGASITGGDYMAIDHNQQVVHIETPYDDIIIQLNSKLNKTYVSYGYLGSQKVAAQAAEDSKAYSMDKEVAVKRSVSKSSRLYKNSKWDLVDAVEADEVELAQLAEEELPAELKGKSKNEIERYISEKKEERKAIQKQIQELNVKRKKFIAENQKEESGELENAMLNAIKTQAAKKNYKWD
ncbi:VWA domain-containing protein [Muricauda sp. 2012CJ35-5]|uniref:VWA domain-containing protein n=1 Tax=Flagellimonas spongiicola TaxID=2942208 RepID=A0ABT0PU23_9FLAO|nr:VWA domain-containing protein [Allomuricauda spongiicola]MCL6274890.1 VWA domain-containing protein [Allomuricauda spongiicola]